MESVALCRSSSSIWGRTVTDANTNTQVTQANSNLLPATAHVGIPTLTTVINTITADINALPLSKGSPDA